MRRLEEPIDRNDSAADSGLLDMNAGDLWEILPSLFRLLPARWYLSSPIRPDPLADLVRLRGFHRVLSTGTYSTASAFVSIWLST